MSPSTSGPVVGDAVADDLVDRGAQRLREAVVVERARVAAPGDAGLVADRVELVGGDARARWPPRSRPAPRPRPGRPAACARSRRATSPPARAGGRPRRCRRRAGAGSPPAPARVGLSRPGRTRSVAALWQRLNFLPLPHQQGSLALRTPVGLRHGHRPRLPSGRRATMAACRRRRSSRCRPWPRGDRARQRADAVGHARCRPRSGVRRRARRCCSSTSGPTRPRAGPSARWSRARPTPPEYTAGGPRRAARAPRCRRRLGRPDRRRRRPRAAPRPRCRGHHQAQAALELAVLDAQLRAAGRSLAGWLGATADGRARPAPPSSLHDRRGRSWPRPTPRWRPAPPGSG